MPGLVIIIIIIIIVVVVVIIVVVVVFSFFVTDASWSSRPFLLSEPTKYQPPLRGLPFTPSQTHIT